jgi:hypothetical protein
MVATGCVLLPAFNASSPNSIYNCSYGIESARPYVVARLDRDYQHNLYQLRWPNDAQGVTIVRSYISPLFGGQNIYELDDSSTDSPVAKFQIASVTGAAKRDYYVAFVYDPSLGVDPIMTDISSPDCITTGEFDLYDTNGRGYHWQCQYQDDRVVTNNDAQVTIYFNVSASLFVGLTFASAEPVVSVASDGRIMAAYIWHIMNDTWIGNNIIPLYIDIYDGASASTVELQISIIRYGLIYPAGNKWPKLVPSRLGTMATINIGISGAYYSDSTTSAEILFITVNSYVRHTGTTIESPIYEIQHSPRETPSSPTFIKFDFNVPNNIVLPGIGFTVVGGGDIGRYNWFTQGLDSDSFQLGAVCGSLSSSLSSVTTHGRCDGYINDTCTFTTTSCPIGYIQTSVNSTRQCQFNDSTDPAYQWIGTSSSSCRPTGAVLIRLSPSATLRYGGVTMALTGVGFRNTTYIIIDGSIYNTSVESSNRLTFVTPSLINSTLSRGYIDFSVIIPPPSFTDEQAMVTSPNVNEWLITTRNDILYLSELASASCLSEGRWWDGDSCEVPTVVAISFFAFLFTFIHHSCSVA